MQYSRPRASIFTYVYLRKRFGGSEHVRSRAETERLADTARPFLTGESAWTP